MIRFAIENRTFKRVYHRSGLRCIVTNQPIMIFGSNTDVGKTIISTGLCRSALQAQYKVFYLKPVQTGALDEYFIKFYSNPNGTEDIRTRTIYHWSAAKSPHIASQTAKTIPPSDAEILRNVRSEIDLFYNAEDPGGISAATIDNISVPKKRFLVCETAGGVLSPGPNRVLQSDVYRPMRLPVLLVGDSKLGGITTTLSAYESLRLRGYTVHAIAMIDPPDAEQYGNTDFIDQHLNSIFCDKDNKEFLWNPNDRPTLHRFSRIPTNKGTLLHDWFNANSPAFDNLFRKLSMSISLEYENYRHMRRLGKHFMWWPFTQHQLVKDENINFIESSSGDHFKVISSSVQSNQSQSQSQSKPEHMPMPSKDDKIQLQDFFDGSASWWTQAVGHGNAVMALSIAEAAGRYGHVLSPTNLHPNVVQLSKFLIEDGPGRNWASKVFYSDDGSTGMEVAIKMAMRLFQVRSKLQNKFDDPSVRTIVLAQKDSYHGDTLGGMQTSEPNSYNRNQHKWYQPLNVSIPVPVVAYRRGVLTIDVSSFGDAKMTKAAADTFPPAIGSSTSSSNMGDTWWAVKDVMDLSASSPRHLSALSVAYSTYIQSFLDTKCIIHGHSAEMSATSGSSSSPVKAVRASVSALILEPIMIGAGGIKFVDPLFQRILVIECRRRGIPVVYDEVAVGMYRLGPSTTADYLRVCPDIATYGKMISGGYIPIAATLATAEVFDCFLGADKADALLHGHSYTANPIACAAALQAIRIMQNSPLFQKGVDESASTSVAGSSPTGVVCSGLSARMTDTFGDVILRELSLLPGVRAAMGLGSVLSIELAAIKPTATAASAGELVTGIENVILLLKAEGILARPLGNILYIMTTPLTTTDDRDQIVRSIKASVTKTYYHHYI